MARYQHTGIAHVLNRRIETEAKFKTRSVLDHIAPQAFGFAAALLVRRVEKEKRRVWILCPDVKTQDHVHAELGVWQCPALYFPRLGHIVEGALADPEVLAERTAVLSARYRW